MLFNTDIAGIMNAQMGPQLPSVTLVAVTEGARGANSTSGKQLTETAYPGRGFVDSYSEYSQSGGTVTRGDRKVSILGASLAVIPKAGDRVTAEGTTYRIISVDRDPAGALYECQCRV